MMNKHITLSLKKKKKILQLHTKNKKKINNSKICFTGSLDYINSIELSYNKLAFIVKSYIQNGKHIKKIFQNIEPIRILNQYF